MSKSRTLWPKVSAAFVEKNLTGHKILGLAVAAVLYLICLSGTATVFYVDMERWETADRAEVHDFRPEVIAAAVADMRRLVGKDTKETALYIAPPTEDYPRLVLSLGESHVRVYDENGRYSGPGEHPVTHGLTELHYYLHLPESFGMIVVGIGGVVMLALILGGLLAHPRILKDAFLWRLNGTPRVNRADLHNRIGVWASPFHIVLALTGALIGLSQIIVLVMAIAFYHGDTTRAFASIYPDISAKTAQGQVSGEALIKALTTLQRERPDVHPNFIAINNIGTDHENIDVSARVDDRMVYGDNWQYDGKGDFVAQQHLSDGAAGRQIYASLYRLHFGDFGGVWVCWAYMLMGAGLCLVCTTGIDIWLMKSAQKGRPYTRLHKVWTAFVWGALAAMAMAALLTFVAGAPYGPVFWGLTAVLSLAGLLGGSVAEVSKIGRCVAAAALLAVAGAHGLRFGVYAFTVGLGINLGLVLLAAMLVVFAIRKKVLSERA